MKTSCRTVQLALVCMIIHAGTAFAQGDILHPIQYQSPRPGAKYCSPSTTIIIRPGGFVEELSVYTPLLFEVKGSKSGWHNGTIILSDDQKTIIFSPEAPFLSAETVTVKINQGLRLKSNAVVAPTSFEFTVASASEMALPSVHSISEKLREIKRYAFGQTITKLPTDARDEIFGKRQADVLPADFPRVRSTVFDTTSPGVIFLSNLSFDSTLSTVPYLMILDNSGAPVFYRKMRAVCTDFKRQPNGLLTFHDSEAGYFYAMDNSYAVVDSFRCGNGYATDGHELRILENGHALLLAYVTQMIDMSEIVPGGNSSARVVGLILQELDLEKNVVFQWRSWDHFSVTDATNQDLIAFIIDYVHGNAIEHDDDYNLLISCRHMDEITKINRETGEIVWRFGGKNNQFTFVNDPIGFSHQHAIRRLPNGNITLFDNGNYHDPPFSRVVEYELDEQQKTATLVWQHRNSPDILSVAMGYAQRLENDNTLIGWGTATPTVTEVRSDGSKVFELTFDRGIFSYRAYRSPWEPEKLPIDAEAPKAFSLSQNYPNPFYASATIRIHLRRESTVTFKVYDVMGREVITILNQAKRSAGEYSIRIDAFELPSGIYFYQLVTESYTEIKKMVVSK